MPELNKTQKKVCTRCKVNLPLSAYTRRSNRPSHRSHCKQCEKAVIAHRRATSFRRRLTDLVRGAKFRAAKKRLKFALTKEWIEANAGQTCCAVTGIRFDMEQRSKSANPLAPSLDRCKAKHGYTPENTRIVCWYINNAKGSMSDGAFKRLIGYAAEALYEVDLGIT